MGGLPTGRPSLLCGAAGCGKTLFAMTFLVNGARSYGENGRVHELRGALGRSDRECRLARLRRVGADRDKKLVIDYVRVEPARSRKAASMISRHCSSAWAMRSTGSAPSASSSTRSRRLFSGFTDQAVLRAEFGGCSVAEGSRRYRHHHRRARRWPAHPLRHRGIRFRLRDPAGQPRARSGHHASPAYREISRLGARHQRISLPDRR
jgi:hypothetical protein